MGWRSCSPEVPCMEPWRLVLRVAFSTALMDMDRGRGLDVVSSVLSAIVDLLGAMVSSGQSKYARLVTAHGGTEQKRLQILG